jgi:hypothetical protein
MGVPASFVEVLAPSGSDGEGFLDAVLVSPSQTSIYKRKEILRIKSGPAFLGPWR